MSFVIFFQLSVTNSLEKLAFDGILSLQRRPYLSHFFYTKIGEGGNSTSLLTGGIFS